MPLKNKEYYKTTVVGRFVIPIFAKFITNIHDST